MLRSLISVSVLAVSVFVTGCAGTQQYQLPNVIVNAVNNRVARAIDSQAYPQAQTQAQDHSGRQHPGCKNGAKPYWLQDGRPGCQLQVGQQPPQQNIGQSQQNSNPSIANPGFIAAYPGGYQYEGRTYNHQPVNTPTIASKPCRTVYQNGRQYTQC